MPLDRQPIPVDQAPRPCFVGIDVGGTSIKLGLVDDDGRILGQTSIPTDEERGPADAFLRGKEALDRLIADLRRGWKAVAR